MLRLLFIFASLLSTVAFASDHVVLNGGGLAEQRLAYSFLNFDRVVALCEALENCHLNESEKKDLAVLVASLPLLKGQKDWMLVRSEGEAPGLFYDTEGRRLKFVTEKILGKTVYVNRDLLYRPDGLGNSVPLALEETIGLMNQILSFQLLGKDDLSVVETGVTLGTTSRNFGQDIVLGGPGTSPKISAPDSRIRFTVVNSAGVSSNFLFSDFLLRDSESMYVLRDSIKERLQCAGELLGFNISDLTIKKSDYNAPNLRVDTAGKLRYLCSDSPRRIRGGNVTLSFVFNEVLVNAPRDANDRAFLFDESKFELEFDGVP